MASTEQDRIKIAEWLYETEENSLVIGQNRELLWLTDKDGKTITASIRPIPDPFTDANDDYAVLEYARKKLDYHFTSRFYEACANITRVSDYQIGDYARAALKVIDQ